MRSNDLRMVDDADAANSVRSFLTAKEWPAGLQSYLLKDAAKTPYRFFICDDSGSMASCDGNRVAGDGSNRRLVRCSRWSELTDALRFHANLARLLGLSTEFRLLNHEKVFQVGKDSQQKDFDELMSLFERQPGGGTPLCKHIKKIATKLSALGPQLRASGQKAVIVIATDGESSDGDIAAAMAPLRQLPVHVIVRLCTDQSSIAKYWNSIDQELEIEMDVIDDFVGEASEISKVNGWLCYGEPIHKLREFGVTLKELDMIDERKLSGDQIMTICGLILDMPVRDIPHPDVDLDCFVSWISERQKLLPQVWSPLNRHMASWIDVSQLRRHYQNNSVTTTDYSTFWIVAALLIVVAVIFAFIF